MQLLIVVCSVLAWIATAPMAASEPSVAASPAQIIPLFKPSTAPSARILDPKSWNPDAKVAVSQESKTLDPKSWNPDAKQESSPVVTASGSCTSVSVVGVGIFCIDGPVCSGNSASGACPEARPGLEQGSHCALVNEDVYGCRPGPRPE